MEYWIGLLLALGISGGATLVGFDRDRVFYPMQGIIVAMLYVLFAAMASATRALLVESVVMAAFIVVATLGFKRNLWFAAAALFAHGIFDIFHAQLITNPGVPVWWPGFCSSYDVAAAGYLAWMLNRSAITARVRATGDI